MILFPKVSACAQAPSQVSHFPGPSAVSDRSFPASPLGSSPGGCVCFTRMSDVTFFGLPWVSEHYHGINNTRKSRSDGSSQKSMVLAQEFDMYWLLNSFILTISSGDGPVTAHLVFSWARQETKL